MWNSFEMVHVISLSKNLEMMIPSKSRRCSTRSINSLAPGRYSCKFQLVICKFISRIDVLSISCPEANATRHHWWSVNTGSGNGLVPSGNKPLPEPMLTQIYQKLTLSASLILQYVNGLPVEIRLCNEIVAFNQSLKTYLFVKFINDSMLVIYISINIIKHPRMLPVQFVALHKPCKLNLMVFIM